MSYEGAGLYSAQLWAQQAAEKIEELEASDRAWLLQVSFTSSSPSYQAPDTFMELYDNQSTYTKVISSGREGELRTKFLFEGKV